MKMDFHIEGALLDAADYRSFRAILEVRAALRAPILTQAPTIDRDSYSFTRAGLDRIFGCGEQGKDRLNLCSSSFGESGGVETLQQPGDPAAGTEECAR